MNMNMEYEPYRLSELPTKTLELVKKAVDETPVNVKSKLSKCKNINGGTESVDDILFDAIAKALMYMRCNAVVNCDE